MNTDVRFETDRLRIRPYCADGFEDYVRYIMEPHLQRMLGLHDVDSREAARETFQWLMENRTFLALIDKTSGRAIGHICLHPPVAQVSDDPLFRGKTGYSVSFAVAKELRRKGLAEEALRALIDAFFSEGKADYFDCEYTTVNVASRALQEKLGFSEWCRETFDGEEIVINVIAREAGDF